MDTYIIGRFSAFVKRETSTFFETCPCRVFCGEEVVPSLSAGASELVPTRDGVTVGVEPVPMPINLLPSVLQTAVLPTASVLGPLGSGSLRFPDQICGSVVHIHIASNTGDFALGAVLPDIMLTFVRTY